MRMRKYMWGMFSVISMAAGVVYGHPLLTNGDFERVKDEQPLGWTRSDRDQTWQDQAGHMGSGAILSSGDGENATRWSSSPISLFPGACYRFSFRSRSEKAAGGTVVSGTGGCNVDIGVPPQEWTDYSNIFVTPSSSEKTIQETIHLGQWHVKGDVFFDDAKLVRVFPIYSCSNGIFLGEGEELSGNTYQFQAPFRSRCRNSSRPLKSFSGCSLNTDRWCMSEKCSLIYQHAVAGREWTRARLSLSCGYYVSGAISIAISGDLKNWKRLGSLSGNGKFEKELPTDQFPSKVVYVRIRGEDDCNLQISDYSWKGELTGKPVFFQGRSSYLELLHTTATLPIRINQVGDALPGGRNWVELQINNQTGVPYEGVARVAFTAAGKDPVHEDLPLRFPETGVYDVKLPYPAPSSGNWRMSISVGTNFLAECDVSVPSLYNDSYGELLSVRHSQVALWRASSGWKIPRYRTLPKKIAKSLTVRTARNEAETVQLVVTPNVDLHDVKVIAGDLRCGKHVLPARQIDILRVGYVKIKRPTDSVGCRGEWPDPLPPQKGMLTVKAGSNQPFWIRVFASKETPAGIYRGTVTVEAAGGIFLRVPLCAEVFDFTLPDQMTCESAFGMGESRIFQYHNLQDTAQKRELYDRYLRLLSKSHITPYNPAALSPMTFYVEGVGDWSGSGKYVTDEKFSGKGCVQIIDADSKSNSSWKYKERILLPQKDLHISFQYKTATDQSFIVSLGSFDVAGQWIYGRNRDFTVPGKKYWTQCELVYPAPSFPQKAQSFTFTFFPAGWQDDGAKTGTVWVDDLKVIDSGSGKSLVKGGDFEPQNINNAKIVFDWKAWDEAMEHAFDDLHFTCFRMPISGLGGGTYASRTEPSFCGFPGGSEEYEILMKKYLGGIESHLREKGWLDKAYVYWFDEPAERDYDFVMNGFNTLKRYAPGLRRLLTEQAEEKLAGGPNLWVPLTPSLHVEEEANCRAAGDQFWWYVCCGPHAPFVTEFIDHPGSEMRLWLWQTWGEKVTGILLWETVWWTSDSAYPDPKNPQNPYEDPMSWVSGYSTPKGTKLPWGNGDGRFIYPPKAAATGTSKRPVMDDPVTSYRLEMLREGMEDYEYFAILERLLEEKKDKLSQEKRQTFQNLLCVPKDVYTSLTSFTVDPAPMESHRKDLAHAIESLLRLK